MGREVSFIRYIRGETIYQLLHRWINPSSGKDTTVGFRKKDVRRILPKVQRLTALQLNTYGYIHIDGPISA